MKVYSYRSIFPFILCRGKGKHENIEIFLIDVIIFDIRWKSFYRYDLDFAKREREW